jgi:hypothetical protein
MVAFQDLGFLLSKCLSLRDSLGLAEGAVRESCQKTIQCNLSFQPSPDFISERLLQEASFSLKQQENIASTWYPEESQSVVPRSTGQEETECENPQWGDEAVSTAEAS